MAIHEIHVAVFIRRLGFLVGLLPALPLGLPPDFVRKAWVTALPGTPTKMEFAPDGRLFIAGDDATVRIVKAGKLLPVPFVNAPAVKKGGSIRGLALDPEFATSPWVYLFFFHTLPTGQNEQRVSRFRASVVNPDMAEVGSEQVIMPGIAGTGHQGGGMYFGKDGMLYVATGSPGSQDLSVLGGKVLRLNPKAYPKVIPEDNPFVGRAGARPEIFALGLREPFSSSVDPATGEGYIHDVGGSAFEEVNKVVRGANYGHPKCEGLCGGTEFTAPFGLWANQGGSCIAGGTFYRGRRFPPAYEGSFFASDETKKKILWRGAKGKFTDWETTEGSVTEIRVGPDGALYWADRGRKTVFRTEYTGPVAIADRDRVTSASLPEPISRVIRAATGESLRFASSALRPGLSLRVFDLGGRPVGGRIADPSPTWNPREHAAGPGTYYYLLESVSPGGETALKRGTFFIL